MDNIKNIAARLDEFNIDAMLILSESNRMYAVGAAVSEGAAVVARDESIYITDSRYIEAARRDITCAKVKLMDRANPRNGIIRDFLKDKGLTRLGFEENRLSCMEYTMLENQLGVQLIPAADIVDVLRQVKNVDELEKMRKAQKLTDDVFAEVLDIIHEGMTEKELAAEIIYRFYKMGADGLSFPPIVVSGPNSSLPHGVPTERKLQKGDFITMDIGCVLDGYCSDMTRTVALYEASDEMVKVYETVLAAQKTGIAAAKAGVTGRDIDGAARKVISDVGYGEYFGHSFGHSLGLEIHEAPNAAPANEAPMPAGAVVSAEPGIYLPGKFGVRIEDVIIIGDDGCEDITNSPKQLIIVKK